MHTASVTGHVKGIIRDFAPRPLLKTAYRRRFFSSQGWNNLHFGVFGSFGEAERFAADQGTAPHYAIDHEQWFSERMQLRAHDYPVLFWLQRVLGPGSRVADLGGSVGVSYYLFGEHNDVIGSVDWAVCELPEVAEHGRRIATARGASRLTFNSDFSSLNGVDCLFSAGALQFIEPTLDQLLTEQERPPKNILVNRLVLTRNCPAFVTLQHTGRSIAPCRVDNYDRFVNAVLARGYELADHWKCLENSMDVPLHPEATQHFFHGFYFRRVG